MKKSSQRGKTVENIFQARPKLLCFDYCIVAVRSLPRGIINVDGYGYIVALVTTVKKPYNKVCTFTPPLQVLLALALLASLYVGSKNGMIANSLCVLRENLGCVLGVPARGHKKEGCDTTSVRRPRAR